MIVKVLGTYALIQHEFREAHRSGLSTHLHQTPHVARAQQQLRKPVRDLVAGAAAAGQVRGDVAADELATFCLNALTAATSLPSKAAVQRLVQVTLAGLRPNAPSDGQDGR
jgi:DNA-binding ferritin-like protein (Dps family)